MKYRVAVSLSMTEGESHPTDASSQGWLRSQFVSFPRYLPAIMQYDFGDNFLACIALAIDNIHWFWVVNIFQLFLWFWWSRPESLLGRGVCSNVPHHLNAGHYLQYCSAWFSAWCGSSSVGWMVKHHFVGCFASRMMPCINERKGYGI